jgi:hypothetical protein
MLPTAGFNRFGFISPRAKMMLEDAIKLLKTLVEEPENRADVRSLPSSTFSISDQ